METSIRPTGVALSTDLRDPEAFPYFLWDDPIPVREVRRRLRSSAHAEKVRLLAKILREARDTEVWEFTTRERSPRSGPICPPTSDDDGPSGTSFSTPGSNKDGSTLTRLDDLQQEVLAGFFGRESGFFLTGGAALAGYHLGHRTTKDLDLFTTEDRIEEGVAALTEVARGTIRVDPPQEILANKLCALLSRAEIRDLVDVRALEMAGYSVDEHLASAQRKDGGLTPGQLAWVLSQIEIGEYASVPGEVTAIELREYLEDLKNRLAGRAFPE